MVVAASPTADKPHSGGKRDRSQHNKLQGLQTQSPRGPGNCKSSPKGNGERKAHGDTCYFYDLDVRGLTPKRSRSGCTRKHERIPDDAFDKMRRGSPAGSSKPNNSNRWRLCL